MVESPLAPQARAAGRGAAMDFEKYTDRAQGFVQSAQSLALREGHQQFTPEHLLKVLLDDPEGLASGLIDRAGGRSREALSAVEAALAKLPKVSGGGAGQVYLAPALARVFDQAQKVAEKAGDSYLTQAPATSRSSDSCLHSRLRRTARRGAFWPVWASRRRTSTRRSTRCDRAAR